MTAPSSETALTVAPANAVAQAEPTPQFVAGFDGASAAPFPPDVAKLLTAPPDPRDVEIKPDGIVYLPGVWYRRRLTAAFGPGGWALMPRSAPVKDGDLVMYHGALFAQGRFVSEAMGECMYRAGNDTMTYAGALEGARTDCISRCCKDLGMGAEMWDPQWREAWKREYATSYKMTMTYGKWKGQERTQWKRKGAKDIELEPTPEPKTAVTPSGTPHDPVTGEVKDGPRLATDEQKAEIRKDARTLKWNVQILWAFLAGCTEGKCGTVDKLTFEQAESALLELESVRTNPEVAASTLEVCKARLAAHNKAKKDAQP